MLKIENIHSSYGGSRILQGIDMEIPRGKVVALMGRNGVGKTTLMKTVVGLVSPESGKIFLDHRDITGIPTYLVSRLGISYVPQGREIFPNFTVYENLKLGNIKEKRKNRVIPEYIYEYFPILKERKNQLAGFLSGGEQQMLAIARALVSSPQLILLDEPSEGIQPTIVKQIAKILAKINQEKDITILVVEQNVNLVLDIAGECFFMEKGRIVDHVETEILRKDDGLIAKHLAI